MNPVYKSIAKASLKKGFEYLAKNYGAKFLTGFWGGLIITFVSPWLARLLRGGVYKVDEMYLTYANSKDKKTYLALIKEGQGEMTEEEVQHYKKTFLKKLRDVLSIRKYLKK